MGKTKKASKTKELLNCDSIEMVPQSIDWQEALDENGEGWRAIECSKCDGCGRMVVSPSTGECEHRELEEEITVTDADGADDTERNTCRTTIYNEGPMMNYWYPVAIDDCEDAARKIASLPLCVVEFADGQTGVALTGGGMDLSWEICEAFMLLGYQPPLHFCDLPSMAGRGTSERDLKIIAACMASCKIAEGWAASKRLRLADLKVKAKARK